MDQADRYFLTSRAGRMDTIRVYRYRFSEDLKANVVQYRKFRKWLRRNRDLELVRMDKDRFSVLSPLEDSWQYELVHAKDRPTEGMERTHLSEYISRRVSRALEQDYDRFPGTDLHILEALEVPPFILHRCVSHSVEMFSDGGFFVHLDIQVKTLGQPSFQDELDDLDRRSVRMREGESDKAIWITQIHQKSFRKYRYDLREADWLSHLRKSIQEHEGPFHYSVDYRFLALYYKEIFGKAQDFAKKPIEDTVALLQPVAQKIAFPACTWHEKPFFRFELLNRRWKKNIQVGGPLVWTDVKAAYYNGIHTPVSGSRILCLAVDGFPTDDLHDQIHRFNKHGELEIMDDLLVRSDEPFDPKGLKAMIGQRKRPLLMVCTRYRLTGDFIEELKRTQMRFQFYQGKPSGHSLSNYVVSSLVKMGGHLNIIKDLGVSKGTFFLGVDLGHRHSGAKRSSRLALSLFDERGVRLAFVTVDDLPLDEVIRPAAFRHGYSRLMTQLEALGLSPPEHIIMHRDGRAHPGEAEHIMETLRYHFGVKAFDMLCVIKSGYPLMLTYSGSRGYAHPAWGSIFWDEENGYAIMTTNTQATKTRSIPRPMVLKKVIGDTPFQVLTEQALWFTKVYTNNLYHPTRLPATTQLANNRAGTGEREFLASYLG